MPFTVYLSSTLKDLEAERRGVQEALGDECIVRHSYRASEEALVDSCLSWPPFHRGRRSRCCAISDSPRRATISPVTTPGWLA